MSCGFSPSLRDYPTFAGRFPALRAGLHSAVPSGLWADTKESSRAVSSAPQLLSSSQLQPSASRFFLTNAYGLTRSIQCARRLDRSSLLPSPDATSHKKAVSYPCRENEYPFRKAAVTFVAHDADRLVCMWSPVRAACGSRTPRHGPLWHAAI